MKNSFELYSEILILINNLSDYQHYREPSEIINFDIESWINIQYGILYLLRDTTRLQLNNT
jgi:hypothetical protein